LDGHDCHNFIELIDTAVENNVHIIELPAHTSHWLQPCDRTVFGPFKSEYRKACDELSSSFPGTVVCGTNFCRLLKITWEGSVTPANITSGFRACGIYPFNPEAVPSEAYIPNSLYAAPDVTEPPTECMTAATDTASNCNEHSSKETECANNVLPARQLMMHN